MGAGGGAVPERMVKEMGLKARDFLRVVPLALGGRPFEVSGNGVVVAEPGRRLEITLTEQPPRRLGPTIRVPVMRVEIEFSGYSDRDRADFMILFDRYFLRAGG